VLLLLRRRGEEEGHGTCCGASTGAS
jgi:hypothetical protein